jgi:DNA-binding CsgD family transcriptional regulator
MCLHDPSYARCGLCDIRHIFSAMKTAAGRSARGSPSALTAREREILELVAEGSTNGQIVEQLWISSGPVWRGLENVYGKLSVHTWTAAVRALGGRRCGSPRGRAPPSS